MAELARQETVVGSLIIFAILILSFRLTSRLRERTRFKITLETLVMVAFLTMILSQSGGETSPLVNLYLLPIITAALALGKRATILVMILVCACYFMLAILRECGCRELPDRWQGPRGSHASGRPVYVQR